MEPLPRSARLTPGGGGAKRAGMFTAVSPLADDDSGVLATVDGINTRAARLAQHPAIRTAALRIVGRVGDDDQSAQLAALARFVRRNVQFVRDPNDVEFTQTADVMLLAIDAKGYAAGDCDDHCELFATLCRAIGIPAEVVAVSTPGSGRLDHVITIVVIDGAALEIDLTQK